MPQTLPTASDVIALTETDLSEAVVYGIIADASVLAADCLSGVLDPAYTSVIKWLAAHMVASAGDSSGAMTSDRLGDAQQSFSRAVTGAGLMGTAYGQQAIALAPCLSGLGMRQAKTWVL